MYKINGDHFKHKLNTNIKSYSRNTITQLCLICFNKSIFLNQRSTCWVVINNSDVKRKQKRVDIDMQFISSYIDLTLYTAGLFSVNYGRFIKIYSISGSAFSLSSTKAYIQQHPMADYLKTELVSCTEIMFHYTTL